MIQKQIRDTEDFHALAEYLQENQIRRLFLVCGKSIEKLPLYAFFQELPQKMGIQVARFSAFSPNPAYESVEEGTAEFRRFHGDMIAAVGGGSAMDVAKCIKLYSNMDPGKNYLEQEIVPNNIPFLAVPTTAGTGSEATRYAVIYYHGEKQSVSHPSCIPSAVLLAPALLRSLPAYQKKVTMMDALCHGIESGWSAHSTAESMEYSLEAIRMILAGMDGYLDESEESAASMLQASNLAGRAINITQTTAGHAMCYKLTSLYGLPHGHSVALCLPYLWSYMLMHMEDCIDPRGADHVQRAFEEIARALGCRDSVQAVEMLKRILKKLDLYPPMEWKPEDVTILAQSVNPVRLKNNPIALNEDAFRTLYLKILKGI